MKVLIDLNVFIDYLQKRAPHYHHSAIVVSEALKSNLTGVVPAHGVTTIYYVNSKHAGAARANENIDWLLANFEIAPADKSAFTQARNSGFSDFEDAVVASLAKASACDFIVTRNLPDFENSPVPAITPEEFVRRYVSLEENPPA